MRNRPCAGIFNSHVPNISMVWIYFSLITILSLELVYGLHFELVPMLFYVFLKGEFDELSFNREEEKPMRKSFIAAEK